MIRDEKDAIAYTTSLEDVDGVNNVHRRACHNLHTFNFEVQRVQQALLDGSLDNFIHNRVKGTVYIRAFEYAVKQRQAFQTNGNPSST
jgi:queuine/archaeosine tRNA-ribosyltransferase